MRGSPSLFMADHRVVDHIPAAGGWLSDADLPDPLGWADVRARPDLAAESLRRRHDDGRTFGHPRVMMYPKPSGGFRRMTRLDPIADLGYRGLVGRTVAPIEGALSGAVFNSRSVIVRTSWCSVPWRDAHKRYRAVLREARQDGPEGEAHLDVKDHYGSVQAETLRHCLHSADAPPGAISDLLEALDQLQSVPGMPRGLPVGPEASAPLGTMALLPLDRVLTSSGFEFYRWADDVVVPMDECEFSRLVDVAARQLEFGGQVLNMDKCAFVELDGEQVAESLGGGGAMQSNDPSKL